MRNGQGKAAFQDGARALRALALLALDTVAQSVWPQRPGARARVLVVRLDRIGDFVLWSDTARAWRQLYPPDRYELTLLGHPSWLPLAEALEVFDRAWPLDARRFVWNLPYRLRQLRDIRRAGFSVVAQARPARDLVVEDAIARASGAAARIGPAEADGGTAATLPGMGERWHTRLLPAPPGAVMELERNAHFLRGLGLTEFRAGVPALPALAPVPAELAEQPYYALFPGASWAGRQWPPERFAEIARRLHGETGWVGVACGGAGRTGTGAGGVRAGGRSRTELGRAHVTAGTCRHSGRGARGGHQRNQRRASGGGGERALRLHSGRRPLRAFSAVSGGARTRANAASAGHRADALFRLRLELSVRSNGGLPRTVH